MLKETAFNHRPCGDMNTCSVYVSAGHGAQRLAGLELPSQKPQQPAEASGRPHAGEPSRRSKPSTVLHVHSKSSLLRTRRND